MINPVTSAFGKSFKFGRLAFGTLGCALSLTLLYLKSFLAGFPVVYRQIFSILISSQFHLRRLALKLAHYTISHDTAFVVSVNREEEEHAFFGPS